MYQPVFEDTIAAIATPPGIGALGIIRVSGADAIEKINGIFPKKDLSKVKSHTLHFGPLMCGDQILDEVLISVFKAPHSFTGENSIEISCHGSPYILQKVMESLSEIGIRPAGPGEYTRRAFLNGKMDLSQAEAVADLIASESASSHKTALNQMRGGFSAEIKALRGQLLHFASLIELELDFAEEDVEFADRTTLIDLLHKTKSQVKSLADSFQLGNVIKSGINVVIAGRPNAGKSTLLNALLNEERAIVSDIAGTTRDTIEEVLVIDGIKFRFIDTAGIRTSTETIERIGISRTFEKMKEADIIIYLYDVHTINMEMIVEDLLSIIGTDQEIIFVANKIDQKDPARFEFPTDRVTYKEITPTPFLAELRAGDFEINPVYISAKTGLGIVDLKKKLISSLAIDTERQQGNDIIITNVRHFTSLKTTEAAVDRIIEGLEMNITGDLLAADIKAALRSMAEITGEITNDEILGNIFGKFCIGK